MVEADIEEGRLVLIRAEGPAPKVVDGIPPEMAYGIGDGTPGDPMLVMFNVVASFATTPVIASR
jgi:hypothetical protein